MDFAGSVDDLGTPLGDYDQNMAEWIDEELTAADEAILRDRAESDDDVEVIYVEIHGKR